MFIQVEKRKKAEYFLLESAVPTFMEFTWIICVIIFSLPGFFFSDKENLPRYFHANHSRRIWAGATVFFGSVLFLGGDKREQKDFNSQEKAKQDTAPCQLQWIYQAVFPFIF